MTPPLNSLVNARDVGAAAAGLRTGVVYRSDAPLEGDVAPPALSQWPPSTVVDLRGGHEQAAVHPLAHTATLVEISLMPSAALEEQARSGRVMPIPEFYRHIIHGPIGEDLVTVLGLIATAPAPVLVHCSAGKDRTGITVAAALRLAGVDRGPIVADYVETARHMEAVLERMWQTLPTEQARADVKALPPEILEAPAEAIEGVLDFWDEYDGGIEQWFAEHGGEVDTLVALRDRLLL